MVEKKSDGKESLKNTVKSSSLGGQKKEQLKAAGKRPVSEIGQVSLHHEAARPGASGGQAGLAGHYRVARPGPQGGQAWLSNSSQPKTFKPKNPEVYQWKTHRDVPQNKTTKFKPTFDHLLNKYVKQVAVSKNRSIEKRLKPLASGGARRDDDSC